LAAILAAAWSSGVTGQNSRPDYRYPSAQDTARQNIPQSAPVQPQQAQAPVAAPAPATCPGCGTVESIRATEKPGETNAFGMIAGGILGGLLGHQIGQGSGSTAATIIGAAGGAYAGNQVEKNVKKTMQYQVTVRMDDGSMRTIAYDIEPGFRAGDKVRFVDGRLTRS
jgi:outer membrane lipoprotein SlyB